MRGFDEIKTRNELADFLNVPRKQLSYVLYIKGVDNLYTSFELQKKNGGVRKINAPLKELKDIQRKLAQALYDHMEKKRRRKSNVSHGFEKGRSIITNEIGRAHV